MTVFITEKKNYRKEHPDWKNKKFLTISEYINIAKKFVNYYSRPEKQKLSSSLAKEILASEDALSKIASDIMMADWLYDENHAKGASLRSFRSVCMMNAIRHYKKYKANHVNIETIDKNYEDDPHQRNSGLPDKKQKTPLQTLIYNEKMVELCRSLVDGTVNRNESICIQKYYIDSMTYQQIGNELGVSKQRVEQLVKNGIAKIRKKKSNV